MARKMSQSSKDKLNAYYEEIGAKRTNKEDEGKPSPSSAASKPSTSSSSGSNTTTSKRKMSQDSWNKLRDYHSSVGADAPAYTQTRITSFNANDLQTWQDEVNSFSRQVSDDYSKRDGVWQDSTTMDNYRTSTTATARELQTRANSFADYLTRNRDQYDAETVDAILSSLEEQSSWLGELGTSLDSEYDYWSQWETAQDYKNHQRWSALDIEKAKADLEALKAEQEILPFKYGESPDYLVVSEQIANDIKALKQDIFAAEKLQTAQGYYDLMSSPDFKQHSTKGAAIENPDYLAAQGKVNIFGWRPGAEGVGNIVTFSRENEDALTRAKAADQDAVGNLLYQHMTEDEVSIYNYILSKDGPEKAQEYLDFIEENLNAREGGARAERIQGVDNKLVQGVAYGTTAWEAGLDQAKSGLKQLVAKDGERLPTSATQFANQALLADENFDGFGRTAYMGVNMIGNMAPSILVGSVLGPTAGAATLGLSAAGNAYNQALGEGYSKAQARDFGIAVGASEALLQRLIGGIASLGGVGTEKLLTKVAGIENWLGRMFLTGTVKLGSEVTEEEFQLFLEPFFRMIIFGEEYDAPGLDEILETAKVTAFSTGLLEGPAIIASGSNKYNNLGAEVASTGDESIRAVIEEGLTADPSSDTYALAKELQAQLDSGKEVNPRQLGMLYGDNVEMYSEDNVEEVLLGAAREAVGAEESNVFEEPDTTDTRTEKAVPYNVMANNPAARANRFVMDTTGYGEHGDKTFRELVDSDTTARDVRQLREAFDPFYQAGMIAGKGGEKVTQFGSPEQRIAYNAGMQDAIAAKGKANQIAAAQKGHKTVGIIDSEEAKRIAPADAQVINFVAAELGTPVYVQETIDARIKDGDKVRIIKAAAEGETRPDGAIVLALDSYTPGDLTTFFHEVLGHRVRQLAPGASDKVINAIVSANLKGTGYSGNAKENAVATIRKKYTDQGGVIPVDIAMEEVSAEKLGETYGTNPERAVAILRDAMGELEAEAKRNGKTDAEAKKYANETFRRIAQWFRDVIAKLKAHFNKNKSTMDAETKAGFQSAINDLTETEQLLKAALKASVQKAQELSGNVETSAEAQKNTTEDGGRRLSAKGYNPIREQLAKAALDKLSDKLGEQFPLSARFEAYITSTQEVVSSPTVVVGSVSRNNRNYYKAAREEFIECYDKNETVNMAGTGIVASLQNDVADESMSKRIGHGDEQVLLDIIPHAKGLIEGGKLLGVERLAHTKNKPGGLFAYRVYNVFDYASTDPDKKTATTKPYVFVATVIQQYDGDSIVHIIRGIEVAACDRGELGKANEPTAITGGKYMVAPLYKFVKSLPRNDGGLKYDAEEKADYLFDYTRKKDGTLYSLKNPTKADADYLAAVKRGDMETAQKMVNEAAKAAGYNVEAWHGTRSKERFTVFRTANTGGNFGSHFTTNNPEGDPDNPANVLGGNGIYHVYLKAQNPFETFDMYADDRYYQAYEIDRLAAEVGTPRAEEIRQELRKTYPLDDEEAGDEFRESGDGSTNDPAATKQLEDFMRELLEDSRYDSLAYQNEMEGKYGEEYDYVILNPEQVKSADPVTYDDNGNVIPLSERFNSENKDIRYSLKDSNGKTLSKEQQEYFKDSKARDAEGQLLSLYHGSKSQLFTEFDMYQGVWLTPDQRYAEVYADQWHSWRDDFDVDRPMMLDEADIYADPDYRLYEVYANITKPLDIGEINEPLEAKDVRRIASALGVKETDLKTVADEYMDQFIYEMTRTHEFIELARKQGFDGFKATEKGRETWCAIQSADQIKKVDNADPTSDPDIRYSLKNPAAKKAVDALGKGANVVADKQGDLLLATNKDKSTSLYSIKTYKDGGRKKLESMLRQKGHSDAEIADTLSLIDDASDYLMMLAADYAKSHGYKVLADHLQASVVTNVKTGRQAMSVMVSNGDYPVNIDTTLTCKKRDAYMKLMTQLVDDGIFDQVTFGGEAIAKVNEILRANGFETACLGCFVESRRLQFQSWANTIVREWNAEVDARTDNAESFSFGKDNATLSDEDISALQKELKGAGKKNAQGNLNLGKGSVREKMGRLLDKVPSRRKHLTTADLLTPKGLAALRAYDPNLFSLVKSRYGAASPKIVQDFTPYASELADLTFAAVKNITFKAVKGAAAYTNQVKREMGGTPTKKAGESANEFKARKAEFNKRAEEEAMRRYLYDIGGVRIQSFSDFMIENVFDYLQIFADLAAGEFPLHGYTKEAICLRLFGMTGAKWNGSWIAHVDKSLGKEYAGLLPASEAKNGNALLVRVDGKEYAIGMDDYARNKATSGETFIQPIGMKDMIALMLDPRYSSNVGSITIGVSDKQILAMLDSPLFSMVIPYHASGMLPQFAKLVGVDLYNDYTDYQNTTVKEWFDAYGNKVDALRDKDGSLVSVDTSYNFNAEFQKTGDAKKAASNYLAWCAKMHPVVVNGERIGYVTYSPKFSNSPYGTDFTKHKNYYKLLEDFTSYDSISGAAAVQGAVTMNFPSETNRLTSAQMDAYKAALRATGAFTEKDIEKYAATANKTFKELIAGEVKGRAEYKVTQDAKWETTYGEVKDLLRSEFNPNGSVFSLKRNKTVEQENAELRETIAALKEQFTITKFAKPDKKAVANLAKSLVNGENSKADVSEVSSGLAELFDMMNNRVEDLVKTHGDAWYSVVTGKAREIAESILSEAVAVDNEVYRQYRDLRNYLRTTKISLDPMYSNSLMGYESIAEFKRAYKGKIRLVNNGMPVDVAYQELAGMFPEYFNEEEHSHPADQLVHIAEVYDSMQEVQYNPYEHDMESAVEWYTSDIIDKAYQLAKAKPTYADKAAAKVTAVRDQKNARIQEMIEKHKEQTRASVLKERAKQKLKIEKLKETVSELEAMVRAYKKADRNADVSLDGEIRRVYQSEPSVFRMAMLQLEPKDRAVVREAYDKLIEAHGAIKPGENPVREVQVPKKTADGRKVSQTVRTVMEAAATPEDALPTIEQMVTDGYFSYDVYTDKDAIADAKLQIDRKTLPIAFADWRKDVESGIVSKQHTVLGWALYNYAVNAGETATAMEVLSLMVGHQRNAAQALQATRVLKQLSPEAQMYEAQLAVERINENLAQREQARIFKTSGKKKVSVEANLPVEEWLDKTGELLTKKLVDRTKVSEIKAKTTAQIILDDLWSVASKRVKAAEKVNTKRSNMDIIEDLFNNQEEFQRAWDAAKAHLEEMYGDDPAVMEALEEWKNSNLDYRAAFSSEVAGKYNVQINPELIDKFFAQKDQEGRDAVMKDIYRDIGSQLPSTFADKWNAWRYMAMLGNLRTHVRNVLGNAGFAPVVLAKDTLATGIESIVSRVTRGKLNRTKSGVVFSKNDRALLKAAWADFGNIQDLLDGGRAKDNANPNKYIEEGRRIFKFKPLEKARRFSGESLETEDMWFSQPHYAYAMAQYCKAHNITAEQIARGKAIDPARAYAMKEAQKATYRDANAFSNFVSRIGRTSDAKNPAGRVMRGLIEGILPFRRTPANILVRGLEYSPAGLLKSLSYDLAQVKKFANTNGEQGISGAQMIDNLSAGLTGTGLMALGIWLAAQGLLRGHGGDDDKEKEFEELTGHQAYSLELPDGTSVTLDWLAPEALPVFVGVNLYETTAGSDKEVTMEALLSSLAMVTEPMLEMSMLQGLNDMIESVGYNKSNGIVAMASSALTSYLTQGLPTLAGQIERTTESERMSTYTDKNNKWLTPDMQYTLGKASQKLPVDFFQIPYVDAWGRKESSGKLGVRAANNMLNPAYTSKVTESAMEKELLRLYDATGEDVFPARASKYITVDKERKDLTGEEYVKYATAKGQNAYKLVTDLTQSKDYKSLDDAAKVEAIQDAYTMADQMAKASISAYKPDKWVTKAQDAKELGLTTSEYIIAKGEYGTGILGSDNAYEAVDAGVDIEEYLDFKMEVKAAGEDGKQATQDEVFDFILDRNLDDDSNWALYFSEYDSKSARAAEKHGISAELFMTAKLDLENIKPDYRRDGTVIRDSRRKKVEKYLTTVCSDYKEYLFLLGMEFESVKDDRDYIAYFGKEDD